MGGFLAFVLGMSLSTKKDTSPGKCLIKSLMDNQGRENILTCEGSGCLEDFSYCAVFIYSNEIF